MVYGLEFALLKKEVMRDGKKKKRKYIWCSTHLVYPKGPSHTRPYPTVSSCYSHVIILLPFYDRSGRETGRAEGTGRNSTTAKMLIWSVAVCVQGYICKFFFRFLLFWKRSRNGFARFYFAPGEHYLSRTGAYRVIRNSRCRETAEGSTCVQ